MIQATTPTFIMTPRDRKTKDPIDLSEARNVYFTVEQKQTATKITKSGESVVVDGSTVSVYLDQSETVQFHEGVIEIQLNWTYPNGKRAATCKRKIEVEENLLKGVVV